MGAAALFALGIGKGIPLIVFGTVGGRIMPRAGAWMTLVKHAFGFVFIGAAIWMAERVLPTAVTTGAWALLIAGLAIYLIAATSKKTGLGRAAFTASGIAALGVSGFVGMAALGGQHPLNVFTPPIKAAAIMTVQVRGIDALSETINESGGQGRMVYLTTDWCISCAVIDRDVFDNPEALAGLGATQLIKLDVTENSPDDQRILAELNAFGPPAVLFVDGTGTEVEATRLVGDFDVDLFRSHGAKAGFLQ